MAFVDPHALAALAPAALEDAGLMALARELAVAREQIMSAEAAVAAEISRRSGHELGYGGLAARHGFRSDTELVQSLTGGSRVEARRLVSVGGLRASSAAEEPWLRPALGLPVAALEAVRGGLGVPTSAVGAEALADAARGLAAEASGLDVDALGRRARELRVALDLDSVGLHEEELRGKRSVRHYRQADGTTKTIIISEPEGAAAIVGYLDEATARRRGKPSFLAERESAGIPDSRTMEQRRYDALLEVIVAGIDAPAARGSRKRRHAVRVLVALRDLEAGAGAGYLEGQSEPVSIATVERIACSAGVIPLLFDQKGRGIDQGRKKRLHTDRQRTLISARDGKCIAPGCDHPPSRCEVHHIIPWSEGGTTTVDDGVLLCAFHHLRVHNNGWNVVRRGSEYFFVPPASHDPLRAPVPAEQASPAVQQIVGAAA